MKRPSSTKEMIEIGIFRFFSLFSKIWKTGKRYNTNKIGDRADPWLILMSTSNRGEENLF